VTGLFDFATSRAVIQMAAGAALLAGAAGAATFVLGVQRREESKLRARMRCARGERPRAARAETQGRRLAPLPAVAQFGRMILRSGLLSPAALRDLQGTLASMRLDQAYGLGLLIGSKLLLAILGPALIWITAAHTMSAPWNILLPCIAFVAGLLSPDMVIAKLRAAQLVQVDRGVPDALDMLVICAQAGIGLQPALARVATEIMYAQPALGRELRQTLDEMQIAVGPDTALLALGTRTGLTSLKRVTATLVQTLQYGTPLAEALRTLSADARQEMLTKVEERAAKLPVMLTMPMIGFILPCVFLIVGGPAVIQLLRSLG
jgi:tight adherence protein C